MRLSFSLSLIFVLLFAQTARAEEAIMTEIPAVIPQENNVSDINPALWAYAVVATDGAVRCEELEGSRESDCKITVDELLPYKWIAKGQCAKFDRGDLTWKLCVASKEKNCLSWEVPVKTMCQALVKTGDMEWRINMVKEVDSELNTIKQYKKEKECVFFGDSVRYLVESFSVMAGYFEGRRDRQKSACESFLNLNQVGDGLREEYFMCEVLFGNEPVKTARNISLDWDVYRAARAKKDKTMCDKIKSVALREICKS